MAAVSLLAPPLFLLYDASGTLSPPVQSLLLPTGRLRCCSPIKLAHRHHSEERVDRRPAARGAVSPSSFVSHHREERRLPLLFPEERAVNGRKPGGAHHRHRLRPGRRRHAPVAQRGGDVASETETGARCGAPPPLLLLHPLQALVAVLPCCSSFSSIAKRGAAFFCCSSSICVQRLGRDKRGGRWYMTGEQARTGSMFVPFSLYMVAWEGRFLLTDLGCCLGEFVGAEVAWRSCLRTTGHLSCHLGRRDAHIGRQDLGGNGSPWPRQGINAGGPSSTPPESSFSTPTYGLCSSSISPRFQKANITICGLIIYRDQLQLDALKDLNEVHCANLNPVAMSPSSCSGIDWNLWFSCRRLCGSPAATPFLSLPGTTGTAFSPVKRQLLGEEEEDNGLGRMTVATCSARGCRCYRGYSSQEAMQTPEQTTRGEWGRLILHDLGCRPTTLP